MKNQFTLAVRTALLFCFFISFSFSLSAAEFKRGDTLTGTDYVRYGKTGVYPDFLRFDRHIFIAPQEAPLYLQKHLKLPAAVAFEFVRNETDKIGMTHTRYRQTINGHPVVGGVIIAHSRAGRVESINGKIIETPTVCPAGSLAPEAAIAAALCTVPAELFAFDQKMNDGSTYAPYPAAELTFAPVDLNFDRADFRLAYKIDVYALQPLSRNWVYVDAQTGEVIAQESRICHADEPGTAHTAYSGTRTITAFNTGSTYELRQDGKNILTVNDNTGNVYTDSDNTWNSIPGTASEYAGDCHFGAEVYHDVMTHFGRNSMDDAGHILESRIYSNAFFNNAFWNGEFATFGDGDGVTFTNFCYPDVVGHEFQHGTTEFSAGLIYSGESGALNESYSDILGKYTEITAHGFANIDWLIAGNITPDGLGIRSMENPNLHDNPDTYDGDFWFDGNGVHTNSGVQNHCWYILSQGKTGVNDLGNSYSVTGIGYETATEIMLRSLLYYLTPSSNYEDAAFYGAQSAVDLYGQCGTEYENMVNAWYAVGVGTEQIDEFSVNFTAQINSCELPAVAQFQNTSGLATDAVWDFGDGNTSTEFSPTHAYTAFGTYDVKLTVTSCEGETDSLLIPGFAVIDPDNPSCDTIIMQTTGTETITACAGVILDPGGLENYPNSVNSTLIIDPPSAASISLAFTEFNTEAGWDFLSVYEGAGTGGTLIGIYDGLELNGSNLTVMSDAATLVFTSDGIINDPGFIIDYSTAGGTTLPTAGFTVENAVDIPFNSPVQFTDASIGGGAYLYDFGDGNISTESSPVHSYLQEGTFNITQIVSNCVGIDTTDLTVTVQSPGAFDITPPEMCVSILAGETLDTFAVITNGGAGDLYYGTENPIQNSEQTSEISFSNPPALSTVHNFAAAGNVNELNLTVTLNGDFDNTFEFATLFVEGEEIEMIDDGDVTNGNDIIAEYTFDDPAQIAGWLADNNLEVTVTNSLDVDPGQGGDETHTVTLGIEGVSFLTVSPLTDIIAPAGSANLDFNFQTAGMLGGDYFYDLPIQTGDPAQPLVDYPVKLTVIGQPLINVLPAPLAFGEHFTGYPATDSLCIYNPGTDTLHVTTVVSDSPEFVLDELAYSIAPLDSLKTAVFFPAVAAGVFTGTVTLQSNAGDVVVNVSGTVIDPPISNVTPTDICVTLEEGETSLQNIIIQNTGNGDLLWSISENSGSGNPVEILAWTYGVDIDQEYPSTIEALDLGFPNYNLSETATTLPLVLAEELEGKGLLLLPESEFGLSTIFINCASVIQEFVAEGGGVIFLYDGAGESYESTGFFDSAFDFGLSFDNITVTPGHPLTEGVDPAFSAPSATRGLSLTDPAVTSLASANLGSDVLSVAAVRDYGAGKAVYLGFDYLNYNDNTVALLGNAVTYAGSSELPEWLTTGATDGTVTGGGTQNVPLTLDATGLLAGTYEYIVSIETNEPTGIVPQVSVKMIVVAAPNAIISVAEEVSCDGIVAFTDESENDPTSWEWDFGDGSTSTQQNPVHNYTEDGVYDVTLTACNDTGCDTQTFNNIITVTLGGDFCEELVFETSGNTTLTSCTGTLYDDGGPDGNYSNSVDYTVTISPPNAETVTLEFVSFSLESCCDDFLVYDGATTAAPLLGNFAGNTIPPDVTSTGSSITVRFDTDGSVTSTGFEVRYQCTSAAPVAGFVSEAVGECGNAIQFTNNSEAAFDYEWNFGDGMTSTEFSPLHYYGETGNFTVVLTAANQTGDDQAVEFIEIESLPFGMSVDAPDLAAINTPVTFNYESSVALENIEWDLGPGGVTSLESPTYIFLQTGDFDITLTGTDAQGCVVTVTHTITVDMNIDTDNPDYVTDFNLSPNPSAGLLQIDLEMPRPARLRYVVSNAVGQTVAEAEYENANGLQDRLDLRHLPSGVYIFRLFADEVLAARRKVIVQ